MNIVKRFFGQFMIIGLLCSTVLVTVPVTSFADTTDTVVYITKTGKCYHTENCSTLKKSKIKSTLQEAIAAGLTACSKCGGVALGTTTTADAVNTKATTTSVDVATVPTNNIEITVWLPKSGKKYHSTNNCGNMDSANARAVTESEAIAKGIPKCSKCW